MDSMGGYSTSVSGVRGEVRVGSHWMGAVHVHKIFCLHYKHY